MSCLDAIYVFIMLCPMKHMIILCDVIIFFFIWGKGNLYLNKGGDCVNYRKGNCRPCDFHFSNSRVGNLRFFEMVR